MNTVQNNISRLVETGKNPHQSVARAMEQRKQKAIGCFPVYVPEEIIHASGMLPVGLWGGDVTIHQSDAYMQSFGCSVVKANLELAIKGTYNILSGIVVTAFCDTLKCAGLDLKVILPGMPVVPVVYAQNRQDPEGLTFMMEEFTALKERMEAISGRTVSEADLEQSLAVYEDYRAAMRELTSAMKDYPHTFDPKTRHFLIKAAYFMDKKEYTGIVREILAGLGSLPKEDSRGLLPVVVTGIMTEPDELLDVFKANGLHIAADDLAQESRQFRTPAPAGATVIERLAKRAQAQRGCALFYDNGESKGKFLIELLQESGARALVVCMMKFCDPEGFDYPLYKKEVEAAGYRLLYLEIEQHMESMGQVGTRVQSFAEIFSSPA